MAFSPDGRRVALGAPLRFVSAMTGGVEVDTKEDIYPLAFSPDGGRLLGSTSDNEIVLWDVPRRRRLAKWRNGTLQRAHRVQLLSHQRLVAHDGFGEIWILDAQSGEQLAHQTVPQDAQAPYLLPLSEEVFATTNAGEIDLRSAENARMIGRLAAFTDGSLLVQEQGVRNFRRFDAPEKFSHYFTALNLGPPLRFEAGVDAALTWKRWHEPGLFAQLLVSP